MDQRKEELKQMLLLLKNDVPKLGSGSRAFVMTQLRIETDRRIDDALSRLEKGTYGYCFECRDEIEVSRLRSLAFATRCKQCDKAREMAEQSERVRGRRTLWLV